MGALVCVKTFSNRLAAEIARNALGDEGIASTVSAEDTAYDISLASGGARLLVQVEDVDAANEILEAVDMNASDTRPEPIQFGLRALFALITLAAIGAVGYAYKGIEAAISFSAAGILSMIGCQILRSLDGRRPLNKFFVAIAGLGMLIYAILLLFRVFIAPAAP